MSIKQAVTSVFKSKDESVSKNFNKMGRASKQFGETSERAFKKTSRAATKATTIMKGFLGAQVVGKGVGLLSEGVRSVTTDFLGFDNAILSASAKFKGLDITTEKGRKTMEALKRTARDVGADTENNATQAAQGLDFLALAGFNANQAIALLPGVTNLATVAQVDLATATDIASDSLGAFGLMTKDTAQLTKNFTRVQDVMAKTTATSNTNLTDLFEAVQKGAPDFTAAGQSIETFSALIGTMANSGIKGAEAGTKLRNIAVRLTGGSKEAAEEIKKMGIRVADSSGNFRDMLDIIDDVIKGTAKMGEVEKARALKVIFGARQTGGLNVILKEGTEQLRSYRQMLIDSTGAAEKMAKIMRSSLMNRLKSLGSALTEVGFQLFSAFDVQGAGAIEALTSAVRKVDMTPVINTINTVLDISKKLFNRFKEIGTQTGLFDSVRSAINQIKPALNSMLETTKTVWNFLDNSGTLKLVAIGLKGISDASVEVSKSFTNMFDTIRPIIEKLDKLVRPLSALIDKTDFEKFGLGASAKTVFKPLAAAAELGGTAFGAVFNPNFEKNRKEQGFLDFRNQERRQEDLQPNRIQFESQKVDVGGKFTFENAPPGSKFEQAPGAEQIPVEMTGASPAEF
jgi:TP901 family phage tail tape measure protein